MTRRSILDAAARRSVGGSTGITRRDFVHRAGVALLATTPWLPSLAAAGAWASPAPTGAPLPKADATLTRIAFGSCLNQGRPQPIWPAIFAADPQLMVMLGDNVYGSTNADTLEPLAAAYTAQAANPEFRAARAKLPMLAIWDDHDFGRNDGGGDYVLRREAAEMFLAFWGALETRPADGGLYQARSFGPAGQRVQLILLDTRSFRSPLKPKSPSFPHWGRYEPDDDASKTVLGPVQWSWLADRLAEPADVRILVSSIQVLAEGHGFERWGNLPAERRRLLTLVAGAAGGRTVIVSGDRHYGAIYAEALAGGAAGDGTAGTAGAAMDIVELTASAMNMPTSGPAQDAIVAPLVSQIVARENFGLVEIDWAGRRLSLGLRGVDGATFVARDVQI